MPRARFVGEIAANGNRSLCAVLLGITLLAGFLSAACSRAPTAGAIHLKATLDKYLNALPDDWGMISAAALNDQIHAAKPFILDLREEREIAKAGYIAGSIDVPVRGFTENLDKLPTKDRPIVVMCSSGQRSAFGMEALQLLGYTDVKCLAGGINAWKAANLPVVTGKPPKAATRTVPEVDEALLAALDRFFGNLPDGWSTLSPAALKDLLATSKPFQLDVREGKEIVDSGSISGSTNIPLRILIKNLDKLPPDKGAPIIVECDDGHRSALAVMALSLLGYVNIRNLAGGFTAWMEVQQLLHKVSAVAPVSRGPGPRFTKTLRRAMQVPPSAFRRTHTCS